MIRLGGSLGGYCIMLSIMLNIACENINQNDSVENVKSEVVLDIFQDACELEIRVT